MLEYLLGGVAVAVWGAFLFHRHLVRQKKLMQGKLIRILLFEKVGNDKVYLGNFDGLEENDEKLGVYILIEKMKKVISLVQPDDYFSDKKLGKCLMVCKYADDDYRVISRLQKEGWLKKVALPIQEYLETEEVVDDVTGAKTIEIKKDKDGEPIPLLDDDGEMLPDHDYIPYEEPLGVDQNHREVMRFNRIFSKRMQEKRKEKPGFWEKYGQMITAVAVCLIMLLGFVYMSNKNTEVVIEGIKEFGDKTGEYIEATNNPLFAEKLLEKIEQKNTEDEAPPR